MEWTHSHPQRGVGIVSFFSGIFQNVWSAITEKVSAIKETIVNGFQSAIDWIKSLPSQAIQWGADIIDGIVSGITGAVGRIGEAAKGVADKITSFLHFSRPDEGPLAEYESWMPDFVGGLAQGIRDSIPVVQKAVEELSGNMRVDAEAEAPRISGGVGVEQEGRLLDLVSRLAEAILNSISTVYRTIAEQFSNIQVSGAVQAPDLIGMDAGTQEREAPGAEHIGELAELIRSGVTAIRQIAVNVTAQEPTVSAENRDSISSEWHGQAAPQGGTVTRKPIDVADSGVSQDGGWQERLLRLVADGITQVRGVLVDAVSGITSYVMGGRPEPPENLKASNWQQPIKTGDDNQGRYQKPGNEKWTVLINSFGELSGIAGAVGTEITGAITALASSSGNILETIVRASTASPKTAAVAGNTTNVYNITQNVNISNEFNGDRAGQEKSSVAMDKATEDATSEMARALKFARG